MNGRQKNWRNVGSTSLSRPAATAPPAISRAFASCAKVFGEPRKQVARELVEEEEERQRALRRLRPGVLLSGGRLRMKRAEALFDRPVERRRPS